MTALVTSVATGPARDSWLRRLLRYQHDAWFGPADPRVLAICRIMLFGDVLWHLGEEDVAAYADFASTAWYPVSFFRAWSIPLLDAAGLYRLEIVAAGAALAALLGAAYRVSAPLAAITTLYLRGVPQNFGKVNHSANLLIIALLVFACARAGDAWSIDAWVRRRWGERPPPTPSGHYRWPIRFIGLSIVTMYGVAGVRKLLRSGLDWALSDSFRLLLLRHHFTHSPPVRIGVWLADSPALCKVLACAALSLETLAPLAMLARRFYVAIVPALFLLQLCIWLSLGVYFRAMLPLFLCLLPWSQLLACLDTRSRARARDTRELSSVVP